MSGDFLYQNFQKIVPGGVSRETFTRLEEYVSLLLKWQKKINLISDSTIPDVWARHILDSTQLISHIHPDQRVADLGSGAGLPGIILSILGIKNVTLVESDMRKVAFLREAARVTNTHISISNNRVETILLDEVDVITARGFAPLEKIFSMLGENLTPRHKMVLLKGREYEKEIAEARANWHFDYKKIHSITDNNSAILIIENIYKTKD
ncbi:MAG TPA: 16S rRNA (guanine(527)-N(7))-methyltransferase RsmG [Rickettsiales bacterium]|nr:16S rRNA (guanine(527)-N(7))-methyltransferase RsmG [Rickettsiales bacterium]